MLGNSVDVCWQKNMGQRCTSDVGISTLDFIEGYPIDSQPISRTGHQCRPNWCPQNQEEIGRISYTVRAEIFAVVLFSRISRVKPSQKFPLQFMSIYSNDNISKIAKLTTRELPHLAKTAKITVRENNGVYSNASIQWNKLNVIN